MTPAPISVDRYTVTGDIAYPIHEDTNGEYVRHSDYAALLQQLAERDAEVERLLRGVREMADRFNKTAADLRDAERAREEAERDLRAIYEAVPGLPIYATEEDVARATDALTAICHLCDKYIALDRRNKDD